MQANSTSVARDSTRVVIDQFNDVFQRHDPARLDGLVGEQCVIENTDGTRHTGKDACVALWRNIATNPEIAFEVEQVETSGENATILWTLYRGGERALRGVNLMLVRAGRIVYARGYSKPV
jgi:hypothetical protein